jgi:hypothetical protein
MGDHVTLYGATILQGIAHARSGTFPASYVRSIGPEPADRDLGSPFHTPEENMTAAGPSARPNKADKGKQKARDDGMDMAVVRSARNRSSSAPLSGGMKLRPALKQAYVEDDEDNGMGEFTHGRANDDWGVAQGKADSGWVEGTETEAWGEGRGEGQGGDWAQRAPRSGW